jgi:hypothetical protein
MIDLIKEASPNVFVEMPVERTWHVLDRQTLTIP